MYLAGMHVRGRTTCSVTRGAPPARRQPRRRWPGLPWSAFAACLVGAFVVGGCARDEASTTAREPARRAGPVPQATAPVDTSGLADPAVARGLDRTPEQTSERTPETGGPRVALVIDDLGQRLDGPDAALLALPVPLTLAVLPGRPHSRAIAALAGQRRDLFLHLPMEPQGYPDIDPGPGALMLGQTPAEIAGLLEHGLASVPGAVGVNNHMGSAATADTLLMAGLMAALEVRGLRFLDSLTTPRSVAWRVARRAGVPCARNRLFLDVDHTDEVAVNARLAELVAVARRTGQAIGIAHPHPVTAAVLTREIPRYVQEGVRFVTASELMTPAPAAVEAPGAGHGR